MIDKFALLVSHLGIAYIVYLYVKQEKENKDE